MPIGKKTRRRELGGTHAACATCLSVAIARSVTVLRPLFRAGEVRLARGHTPDHAREPRNAEEPRHASVRGNAKEPGNA
jgi:hypothetical protein